MLSTRVSVGGIKGNKFVFIAHKLTEIYHTELEKNPHSKQMSIYIRTFRKNGF